jgi:hypothetical protein
MSFRTPAHNDDKAGGVVLCFQSVAISRETQFVRWELSQPLVSVSYHENRRSCTRQVQDGGGTAKASAPEDILLHPLGIELCPGP